MRELTVTEALAFFTIESRDLPEAALHASRRALLDAVGCAFAGRRAPGVEKVVTQLLDWSGRAEATVWWRGARLPAPAAAFANSVAVHALDLDDVHIPSITHLTSMIVPVALAVGESEGASGKAVLEAVAMGVEVAARLGMPALAGPFRHGFLPTTVFGVFGAAGAAARLMGLKPEVTAHAFGLAYAHLSGNRQALFDQTLAKRLQPAIAARSGVESACFAARGLTGAHRVVEGSAGLYALYGSKAEQAPGPEVIARQEEGWQIERLSFKRFSCCGGSHPLLAAAIELVNEHELRPDQITSAELFGVAGPFVGLPWDPAEPTQEQAQFCAAYEVAAAIKYRRFGPAEIAEEQIRNDREVSELAQRITVSEVAHPSGAPTLRLHTRDGRLLEASRRRDDVLHPTAFSDEELMRKFVDNTGRAELAVAILNLDSLPTITDFAKEYLHASA